MNGDYRLVDLTGIAEIVFNRYMQRTGRCVERFSFYQLEGNQLSFCVAAIEGSKYAQNHSIQFKKPSKMHYANAVDS